MDGSCRTVTADRGDAGRRIDLVIRRRLADLQAATRTRVQAWIAAGQVTVNGAPVRRPAARLCLGDVLVVRLPGDIRVPAGVMAAEEVALSVLYEDEHLIAIDKPAGIVVHPTRRFTAGTVVNALLWRARQWPDGHRPSIVGRLDRLTSGVVAVAKTAAAHAALQRALASDHSNKDYLALVYSRVRAQHGWIDLRLGRDARDWRRVIARPTGAASLTEFERLGGATAPEAGLTLLRCRLRTGRMHQIRVHLAARGWPVVGDAKYGEPRWALVTDAVLRAALREFPRQALHAWRLALTHPVSGRRLCIEAPIPADLRNLLAAAGLSECARPLTGAPPSSGSPVRDEANGLSSLLGG